MGGRERLLLHATSFAAEAHKFQKRKNDDSSFICHPLSAAYFIQSQLDNSINSLRIIIATILHDTIEDTSIKIEDIEKEFGKEIASIVFEVTDDRTLSKRERKRAQLEHITKISKEAKFVKAADMYHNLNALKTLPPKNWSIEYIQGYFVWKKTIFEKGIKGINSKIDEIFEEWFFSDDAQFIVDNIKYDCIPKNKNLDVVLTEFFELC